MREIDLKNEDWSKNKWIIAEPVIRDPEAVELIRKKIDECFPEEAEDGT